MKASDARLDDLYREHPQRFIGARNEIAGELRAAGEREAAERVSKLRKPTVAAWLINRAVLDFPALAEELARAERQLEEAQSRALEGDDEAAAEWRAAAAREREAIASILDAATRAARDAAHPASTGALEKAGATLQASAADPELRDLVARGRVERERSAATLGTPATVSPRPGAGRPARRDSAQRRKAAQARRERKRLERDLAEATERQGRLRARVELAAETLREEEKRLAESRREIADLEARLRVARRQPRA